MEKRVMIGRIASRLLSLDTVFAGVQQTLKKTLDVRRAMDRNIERLLAGVNLPSARDVERVITQVQELDRDLALISARVEALTRRVKARR